MSTYEQRLLTLQNKASIELRNLIAKRGVKSQFQSVECLQITDEDLMYNLESGRYLVEITENRLIDNDGYEYHHDVLNVEKFFEIIDHFVEKHIGDEQTTSIAQHEISFYLRDEDGNYLDHIPESDQQHIEKQIIEGVHTGEICASVYVNEDDEEPTDYHGWWRII